MTATEDERLAVEDTALGVVAQIERHNVGSAFVMNIVKSGIGHGNELRLVVRRTRRLGVPLDQSGPQHVHLAMAHAVDVALQLLIGIDGDIL